MLDRDCRVYKEHARARPTHDLADAFALFRLVAGVRAGAAEGLPGLARAVAYAQGAVVDELLAFGARRADSMVVVVFGFHILLAVIAQLENPLHENALSDGNLRVRA